MIFTVAKNGSDQGQGTSLKPFKTIQRAANVAVAGDTISIRGGVYAETVTPPCDGLIFQSCNAETVTVSGADVVTGWVLNGSVYEATMPASLGVGANQVFVAGKMVPEARWPKMGNDLSHPITGKIGNIVSVNATQVVFTDPNITQPDGTWAGATVHFTTGEEWVCTYGTVVSQVGNQLTVNWKCPDTGSFAQTFEWPRSGNRYFLYNTPAAFTGPGEWYYDAGRNKLRLWLAPGIDANTLLVEVKTRKYGFNLSGRKNINICGLFLFGCTIQMDDQSFNNTISSIHARYLSHYTFYSGWEAPDDSGIVIRGQNNSLSVSEIHYSAGDGITVNGSHHTVHHNTINDVNYCASDAAGIRCEWGDNFHINNNYIGNCGRDSIKISNCTNSEVGYNRLHGAMLQATDGGAIYAYGTNAHGTEIHHNIITNVHGGGFGGAGVYLDNKSDGYSVHHNYASDCDHGGKNNSPNTNTIWDKNTFIGVRRAIDADSTSGFGGTVYSNNIFQGNGVLLGNEAVKTNNYGTDQSAFVVVPANVGAFADGDFVAGPDITPIYVRDASVVGGISARSYDDVSNGIKSVGLDPSKPTGVGYCDAGTWLKYRAIDFTKGSSKWTGLVAVNNAFAGQAMEIHLDAIDGPIIGVFTATGTGPNPENWYSYISQSCPIRGAAGIRDVYFVFKGNGVCNIQSFQFN